MSINIRNDFSVFMPTNIKNKTPAINPLSFKTYGTPTMPAPTTMLIKFEELPNMHVLIALPPLHGGRLLLLQWKLLSS